MSSPGHELLSCGRASSSRAVCPSSTAHPVDTTGGVWTDERTIALRAAATCTRAATCVVRIWDLDDYTRQPDQSYVAAVYSLLCLESTKQGDSTTWNLQQLLDR